MNGVGWYQWVVPGGKNRLSIWLGICAATILPILRRFLSMVFAFPQICSPAHAVVVASTSNKIGALI